MKAVYLFASLLFFSVWAMAQTNFLNRPVSPRLAENRAFINKNKQPITRAYGTPVYGVKILPRDNMPCLVPDVSLIAAIPTGKTVFSYQYIPNPYFSYNTAKTDNMNSLLK